MKALLIAIGTCVLLAAPAAHARDPRSGIGPLAQAQGLPMKKGPGQFQRREQGKQAGGQEKHNPGRLTQEERQELHRDLDRANREIYRR